MPRYHFHVHTSVDARDEMGCEFDDLTAAKASAVKNVRALAAEELRRDHSLSLNHSIEITDAGGKWLHTTRYSDCIDVCF
jgi:hypothetical protein